MNQPDFNAPISVELRDIHAANLYFSWGQQTVGFGECRIGIQPDGSLTASTENMSREWLRRALHAVVDTLVDAVELRD